MQVCFFYDVILSETFFGLSKSIFFFEGKIFVKKIKALSKFLLFESRPLRQLLLLLLLPAHGLMMVPEALYSSKCVEPGQDPGFIGFDELLVLGRI